MKRWIVAGLVVLVAVWWVAAAPRSEITIGDAVAFDPSTAQAIAAVDRSAAFATGLERFPSSLPHFDDAVFVAEGGTALVTVTDGQIWSVDLATHAAQPFVDPPLMAYGIHEAPGDPLHEDRLEFGRSLLPDAVTGLENIQARMRQPFAEKRRVSSD